MYVLLTGLIYACARFLSQIGKLVADIHEQQTAMLQLLERLTNNFDSPKRP